MQFLPKQVETRREFFRAGARYGLLTLVSAVATGLIARPRGPAGQSCINSGICSNCGIFAACGLPQALSAKRAKEKG